MKNNSLLKYLFLFGILIFMSNCSTDSDLELLEQTNEIENFQAKSNGPVNCNTNIYIVFNYPPGANESVKQAHRDAYYTLMSQKFTICERYYAWCGRERWSVNNQEYGNYLNDSANTETDDGDDDSGGSESRMKPGCGPWVLVRSGPTPTGDGDTFDDTPGGDFLGW